MLTFIFTLAAQVPGLDIAEMLQTYGPWGVCVAEFLVFRTLYGMERKDRVAAEAETKKMLASMNESVQKQNEVLELALKNQTRMIEQMAETSRKYLPAPGPRP